MPSPLDVSFVGDDSLLVYMFVNELQILTEHGSAGHLLVTTRQHKVKVADMEAVESREIGKYSMSLILMIPNGQRDMLTGTRILVAYSGQDCGQGNGCNRLQYCAK